MVFYNTEKKITPKIDYIRIALVPKGDTNIKYLQENGVKFGMLGLMPMAI
jgi:hypothetical protein